jgi:hypothetical protein
MCPRVCPHFSASDFRRRGEEVQAEGKPLTLKPRSAGLASLRSLAGKLLGLIGGVATMASGLRKVTKRSFAYDNMMNGSKAVTDLTIDSGLRVTPPWVEG